MDEEGYLPPGIHAADGWEELSARFGSTPRRERLLSGLRKALRSLQSAGCARVYIDGSFVTAAAEPGDFDACWEVGGVDGSKLDPVLLTFGAGRLAQKVKYGGELFPADSRADSAGRTFVEFFQVRKDNGNVKGIVSLDLQGATL